MRPLASSLVQGSHRDRPQRVSHRNVLEHWRSLECFSSAVLFPSRPPVPHRLLPTRRSLSLRRCRFFWVPRISRPPVLKRLFPKPTMQSPGNPLQTRLGTERYSSPPPLPSVPSLYLAPVRQWSSAPAPFVFCDPWHHYAFHFLRRSLHVIH